MEMKHMAILTYGPGTCAAAPAEIGENAHAVAQLTVELQLFHWNTVDIHPVITGEEARSLVRRH